MPACKVVRYDNAMRAEVLHPVVCASKLRLLVAKYISVALLSGNCCVLCILSKSQLCLLVLIATHPCCTIPWPVHSDVFPGRCILRDELREDEL